MSATLLGMTTPETCGSRTCKPNSVCRSPGRTVIPLGRASLPGSSDLPGGDYAPSRHVLQPKPEIPPYLVLLRVGFALPAALLPRRCALTAPFHPYPAVVLNPRTRVRCYASTTSQPMKWLALFGPTTTTGRYVFCGTVRRPGLNPASRMLSGTLPCGVRTFLPPCGERPSGPAANHLHYMRWFRESHSCRWASILVAAR